MAGQKLEYFMGRRRYRYGKTADKDDAWRQRMRFRSFIPRFPVFRMPVHGTAMPSVMIMVPHGVEMSFVMITMMMYLVVVVSVRAVPLLIMLSTAAPSVGHGRSAEKHQNHC